MTQATGRICTSICPLTIVAATCRLVLRTLLDLYVFGDPWFVAADVDEGDADWIMVGEVPGLILCVPLAPPNCGDVTKG